MGLSSLSVKDATTISTSWTWLRMVFGLRPAALICSITGLRVSLLTSDSGKSPMRPSANHHLSRQPCHVSTVDGDLEAAIRAGSFRSDLFYRLNVFPIEIAPLRERREDISLLVEYFIDHYARKAGKHIKRANKKTLELLQSYPWPGNIRELQNVIERSVILCETGIFSIDDSWLPQRPSPTEPKIEIELPQKLLAQEKGMIEAALKETRGRVFGPRGAAAKLGIPRSTLEWKIRSLKIDKNRFKIDAET